MHGAGRNTNARAVATRRLAERQALSSIADQIVEPVADPVKALADLAAESVALKSFLAGRVAELASLENVTEGNSEQIRAVVAAYERAMDRAGKFLGDWVKLGLDARAVEVSEREADALEAVVLRALAAAGLPEELEQRFVRALAVELRSEGGS
jgi:hypothetical protein